MVISSGSPMTSARSALEESIICQIVQVLLWSSTGRIFGAYCHTRRCASRSTKDSLHPAVADTQELACFPWVSWVGWLLP